MGRHYTGDIEGRFAFAIQSSDDANFFGVTGTQPELLAYYFEKEDLPKVKKGGIMAGDDMDGVVSF